MNARYEVIPWYFKNGRQGWAVERVNARLEFPLYVAFTKARAEKYVRYLNGEFRTWR